MHSITTADRTLLKMRARADARLEVTREMATRVMKSTPIADGSNTGMRKIVSRHSFEMWISRRRKKKSQTARSLKQERRVQNNCKTWTGYDIRYVY